MLTATSLRFLKSSAVALGTSCEQQPGGDHHMTGLRRFCPALAAHLESEWQHASVSQAPLLQVICGKQCLLANRGLGCSSTLGACGLRGDEAQKHASQETEQAFTWPC